MTQFTTPNTSNQLRKIQSSDAELLSNYYLHNQGHFKMWEPKRSIDTHSLETWQTRIVANIAQHDKGTATYFVAIDEARVVGHCTLSQIFHGALRACYIGYGVSHDYEGKGLAYTLSQHVVSYAFDELKLNRVMANYMPHNVRSERLLKRLGFVREGFARNYLQINGKWENHVLTAKYNARN